MTLDFVVLEPGMSLTFEQRAALIARFHSISITSPSRYGLRVIAWIAIGYVIIGSITLIAIGLAAGAVAAVVALRAWLLLKVAWIPVVFAWMLARSLFVRIDPPVGRRLTAQEAPQLFAAVEEIRKKLGVPKIHAILLETDMNAAVYETPRFGGVFGWRRHLLIGLPLMLTLSPAELRAVLAHELGHLSGRHGRVGAWAYRLRETWSRVLGGLSQNRGAISKGVRRLLEWYVDHFMVITLVQARAQELAADRSSAELTDAATAARSLAWTAVATELLERRLWKPLAERIANEEHPSITPLEDLLRRRAEILAPPYDDILEAELARKTATDATHPSLRDRLEAIGVRHPALAAAQRSAADELLQRSLGALIGECERDWRAAVLPAWNERHAELQMSRERLAMLEEANVSELSDDELLVRADALVDLGRSDEAFDFYATVAQKDARNARAAFCYGRLLLARGELGEGLKQLRRAMELDWRSAAPACELAYATFREMGMEREADVWAQRYRQQIEILERRHEEASSLRPGDTLIPTSLPPEMLDEVLRRCYDAGWVSKVWVVEKTIMTVPEQINVIAVTVRLFQSPKEGQLRALINDVSFVPNAWLFVVDRSLARHLERVQRGRSVEETKNLLLQRSEGM